MTNATDFLFDVGDQLEDILQNLKERLVTLTLDLRLPRYGLVLRDNCGKIARSWSVCVNEPPHPMPAWEINRKFFALSPLYNISQAKGKMITQSLLIKGNVSLLRSVEPPAGCETIVKKKKGDEGQNNLKEKSSTGDEATLKEVVQGELSIPLNAPQLLDYLLSLARKGVGQYKSSASAFGCCSLYEKCSNAGRCIHDNLLYSTVCSYRRNLEAGRIFYGKEKPTNG